jgi:hypothetical protein
VENVVRLFEMLSYLKNAGLKKSARFFLVQHIKTGQNIPKLPQKIPNGNRKYQNFPFKGLSNCMFIGTM